MNEKRETKKYVFTVEGETEQWYLCWLRDQINKCESRKYNVAVEVKVQQNPKKFYKTVNSKTTPEVFHICDVESNEPSYMERFRNTLSEMKEAKKQKNCNGSLSHRRQYLEHINKAYGESFDNLDQYKREVEFKRCLGKLSLDDVLEAIIRADEICARNKKDGKLPLQYKGYSYYQDNPSLSIHDAIRMILKDCGIIIDKK